MIVCVFFIKEKYHFGKKDGVTKIPQLLNLI